MLETLLSFNWLRGFAGCSVIQMYIEMTGIISRKHANIIACILFQTFFVYKASMLLYYEMFGVISIDDLKIQTLINLDDIYGYFIFDTIYMVKEYSIKKKLLFITHHIAALVIINTVKLTLNNYENLFYHNMICFLGEVTNPILNMRQLTFNYPTLKKLNQSAMYYTYLAFRIILFPIFSLKFLINYSKDTDTFNYYILLSIFIGLYGMSCIWFKQIINLEKEKIN